MSVFKAPGCNVLFLQPLLWLAVLLPFQSVSVYAHGEDYWNDFVIDNKNDLVETNIAQVTKVLGDLARGRRQVTSWPDAELRNLRINLIALQEEIEAMLNHLAEDDGIHLQLVSALRDYPQAGRSVAGGHALEIALELVDYISAMEGPEAFIDELETDGVSVYMIDLMDAYTDKMGVYKALQESERNLAEINTEFANRTATADFRFHLQRLLLWMGLDGLAASLTGEAESSSATEQSPNTESPVMNPSAQ